jgi:hypothetical protein
MEGRMRSKTIERNASTITEFFNHTTLQSHANVFTPSSEQPSRLLDEKKLETLEVPLSE